MEEIREEEDDEEYEDDEQEDGYPRTGAHYRPPVAYALTQLDGVAALLHTLNRQAEHTWHTIIPVLKDSRERELPTADSWQRVLKAVERVEAMTYHTMHRMDAVSGQARKTVRREREREAADDGR